MMANYEIVEFVAIVQHLIDKFTICDPASQNHQKVARHGFFVKGRF